MSRPVIPAGQRTISVRDESGRARTWGRHRCRCGVEVAAVVGAAGEPICDPCFEADQRALMGADFDPEKHL